MFKKLKLILFPIIIFCLLVTLCGAVKLIADRSKSLAGDMVLTQSEDSRASGESSESAADIMITTKCDSLDIYSSDSTESDVFDIYIDGKPADFAQAVEYRNGVYTVEYIRTYGEMVIVINSNLNIGSIVIDAPAANMRIRDLTVSELNIATSAGNTCCDNILCDSIIIVSQSGNVNIEDTESTVMQVTTQNGRISVNCGSGEFYVGSNTGNIEFNPTELDLRADLTTMSGDIYADLSDDDGITMYIRQNGGITQISRDFVMYDDRYVKGDGYSVVNIKTDTGDITVE
ncbi:MAG: DUF4097 family beta strand repeat protein [Eubacteriaceae bacterium]|nr:DUF4097 family beta strand repeat protein [Eubacteriaceae bacterium]